MLSLERVQAARSLQNLHKPELSRYIALGIAAGTQCFTGLKGARKWVCFSHGLMARKSLPYITFPSPRNFQLSIFFVCERLMWGNYWARRKAFKFSMLALHRRMSAGYGFPLLKCRHRSRLKSNRVQLSTGTPGNPQTCGSGLTSTEEVWSGK